MAKTATEPTQTVEVQQQAYLQIMNIANEQAQLTQEIVKRAASGTAPTAEEWQVLLRQDIDAEKLQGRVRQFLKIQAWKERAGTEQHRQKLKADRDAAVKAVSEQGKQIRETIQDLQQQLRQLESAVETAQRWVDDAESAVVRLTDTRPDMTVLPEHVLFSIRAKEHELYQTSDYKDYIDAPGRLRRLEAIVNVPYGDGTGEQLVNLARFQDENNAIKPRLAQVGKPLHSTAVSGYVVPFEPWKSYVEACRLEHERLTEWYEHMKVEIEAKKQEIEDLKQYHVK
ncbi:MAG: hypothetical protein R3C12_04400 [Planctomycetaceae bacterium]|nr:hypothetical protein [Planctomycetaceae bacterium]